MSLFLRYGALSDVGRVRKDNQDSGYAGPHLLVVADGVGGAARGDIASSACVEAIRKLDVAPGNDPLSELSATLHLAHDRLAEIVEAHPELDGTSTTLTAAVFDGTHLRFAHVGDSRAYLLRDGVLEQLTSDHTLVQSLVDEGRITEAQARVHPHRNLILRAVDGVHEPEPDLFSTPVRAGDRLLFCSDGCAGVLDAPALTRLLAGELTDVAARLVVASLDAGSTDNVTVVVADVLEDVAEAVDPLVVGAAATGPHLRLGDDTTGNLSDAEVADLGGSRDESPVDPETIRYAPQPPPARAWWARLVVLLVVLGLLGGPAWAAYRYSQSRYYVAEDGGVVKIYRGVEFTIPGVRMHRLVRVTDFTLDELGAAFADEVRAGKDVSSLAIAERFIQRALCLGPSHEDHGILEYYGLRSVERSGPLGRTGTAPRTSRLWTGAPLPGRAALIVDCAGLS